MLLNRGHAIRFRCSTRPHLLIDAVESARASDRVEPRTGSRDRWPLRRAERAHKRLIGSRTSLGTAHRLGAGGPLTSSVRRVVGRTRLLSARRSWFRSQMWPHAVGRAKQSGFAGKNINQGMSTSPCRVTDPRKLEPAATEWKWLHCSAMGCESGRQDSNLRPLVPQTSPHFPMSAEFDLEWFVGNWLE
jgi:hypothetical protein